MKKVRIILLLLLLVKILYAQNPLLKQWDYRFGGTSFDQLYSLIETPDSGFILGGYSSSDISGDKTEASQGGNDYWIVKLNPAGIKQWDKRFGGGNDDLLTTVISTGDGGYMLGGSSGSEAGGDKTQPNWDTVFHSKDYWILKVDASGNKQWDKRFGGTEGDFLYDIKQTEDAGYILAGTSGSDSSGDKSQNAWNTGYDDYWIVKIDSLGNKQWDKRFGGTDQDFLYSILQTTDEGYLLGGISNSNSNGDKTQNSWNQSFDYWIVKIDSSGNKLWDKTFGGLDVDRLFYIQEATPNGFILGGFTWSDSSGDVSQNTRGGADYWIVKIDSLGNKQWDRRFGGSADELEFGYVVQTDDRGYLLSGSSYSNISGDKTEDNLGSLQTWVVKTDFAGNKQWDKTALVNGNNCYNSSFAIQNSENCYVIANSNDGGIGGDKTQPNWNPGSNTFDYWIIKFCDTTLTGISQIKISDSNFSVFPNPFTSDISITIQKQNFKEAKLIICNIFGQTIFTSLESNPNINYVKTIDLSFLSKGIYLLEIIIDGQRTLRKIVKN